MKWKHWLVSAIVLGTFWGMVFPAVISQASRPVTVVCVFNGEIIKIETVSSRAYISNTKTLVEDQDGTKHEFSPSVPCRSY